MTNRQRLFFILPLLALLSFCQCSPTPKEDLQPLKNELTACIAGVDAVVGIGIISPQGDTLTLNNEVEFPLMSVVKFHQALAVADYLDQKKIPLKKQLYLSPKDLSLNTYSPMKDIYPNGNVEVSIAELLTYTLQLSDNIACDVLFDQLVSPEQTQAFLSQQVGLQEFQIVHNEAEMQQHPEHCYENWTSPYAAAFLLQQFLDGEIVGEPYLSFIRQQLTDCQTGANKLPLPLKGTTATIGHKTGAGPRNAEGRVIANNDLGFVTLPDGRTYIIAVFVKDAMLSPQASDQLIADLSTITYRYFLSHHPHR